MNNAWIGDYLMVWTNEPTPSGLVAIRNYLEDQTGRPEPDKFCAFGSGLAINSELVEQMRIILKCHTTRE